MPFSLSMPHLCILPEGIGARLSAVISIEELTAGIRNGRAPVGLAWLLLGTVANSTLQNFRYVYGQSQSCQL